MQEMWSSNYPTAFSLVFCVSMWTQMSSLNAVRWTWIFLKTQRKTIVFKTPHCHVEIALMSLPTSIVPSNRDTLQQLLIGLASSNVPTDPCFQGCTDWHLIKIELQNWILKTDPTFSQSCWLQAKLLKNRDVRVFCEGNKTLPQANLHKYISIPSQSYLSC